MVNRYSLGCYFLLTLIIAIYAASKPYNNWDMLAYAGIAMEAKVESKADLHESVYTGLQQYVTEKQYRRLTDGSDYVKEMANNPELFNKQLAFYRMRVIYNGINSYGETLGANVFRVTSLVSVIFVFLGLLVWLWFAKSYLGNYSIAIFPIIAYLLGIGDIARYSTPDSVAFFFVSLILYGILRKNWIVFFLLPIAILARTDLVIFVGLAAVFIFFSHQKFRLAAIISLLAALLLYVGINAYYPSYGWSYLFYFTFIEHVVDPSFTVDLSAAQYFEVLFNGIKDALTNEEFLLYAVIMIASVWMYFNKKNKGFDSSNEMQMLFLLNILNATYVVIHFLFFPALWERFFIAQYLFAAFCLFYFLNGFKFKKVISPSSGR